jgi:hypothetical protein
MTIPSERGLSGQDTSATVLSTMSSRLSYKEIRRLARAWSDDAREQGEQNDAEIPAWLKQHRRSSPRNFARRRNTELSLFSPRKRDFSGDESGGE